MTVSSTSMAAYRSLGSTAENMREAIADVIRSYGAEGCIMDEVFTHFPTLSRQYSTISGRFSELEDSGVIVRNGETRPGKSKRQQKVMRAVEFASEAPPPPPEKKPKNPFLEGMKFAARFLLEKDSDFKGTKGALALKEEIIKVARKAL